MSKYLLIRDTGRIEERQCKTLADLQAAVGGLITGAYSPRFTSLTVYANDDGLQEGMTYNVVASHVLGVNLFGPVLIGGRLTSAGNVMSLSDKDESAVLAVANEFREPDVLLAKSLGLDPAGLVWGPWGEAWYEGVPLYVRADAAEFAAEVAGAAQQ